MRERPSGARRMPRVVQSLRKPFTNVLACFKRRPFPEGPTAGLSDIWPEDIPSVSIAPIRSQYCTAGSGKKHSLCSLDVLQMQDLMGLQYEGAPNAVPVFDLRLACRASSNEDANFLVGFICWQQISC